MVLERQIFLQKEGRYSVQHGNVVLERQIFLQKEGRYSMQHVLHYPTVSLKVKTPALIGEVNLGCLSILF